MSTTLRTLAEKGHELGESQTELFTTTLYALASVHSGDGEMETVAAQVYEESEQGTPEDAREYVETFTDVFDVDDLGDVDDLLGRQRHLEENYRGHVAFAKA